MPSSGSQTDTSFHSRYAPLREAERFVEASLQTKNPGTVLLLGPGENYIGQVLARRYPWASVYSIQPSDCFEPSADPKFAWSPASQVSLASFLRRALFSEQAAAGVAVLEWEPVMRAFPVPAALIRNEVTRALASAAADRATVSYWARCWLRNCLNFADRLGSPACLEAEPAPIILAAAGPGLNDCLDYIRDYRAYSRLWALASAVPALLEADLRPDLVVATDPGYWSGVHLRACLQNGLPLALPPSACAGTGLLDSGQPIIPLDTGLLFETSILDGLGLSGRPALAFGTAAGTAIDLALRQGCTSLVICGLDFAARGSRSHAQPYAFDILEELGANRCRPAHARRYAQNIDRYPETSGQWRFSRAFSAYANELSVAPADADRVFRLSGSPVSTGNLDSWSLDRLRLRLAPEQRLEPAYYPPQAWPEAGYSPGASKRFLLDKLLDHASQAISAAAAGGQAMSFDSTLILKAIGGKQLAPAISLAARGQLGQEESQKAIAMLHEAGRRWNEYCRD